MSKTKGVDLVQIIKDNPGCVASIDNDCWTLLRESPDNNPFWEGDDADDDKASDWDDANVIAHSDMFFKPSLGDGGYGSGSSYGGDILQALAVIVGIKVESV